MFLSWLAWTLFLNPLRVFTNTFFMIRCHTILALGISTITWRLRLVMIESVVATKPKYTELKDF